MTTPPDSSPARQRLADAAARCDAGADALDAWALDPAAELESRGFHPSADDARAAGERWQAAARGARAYAQQLRDTADHGGDVSERAQRQADLMADAASLGGILIDGRRLDGHSTEQAELLDNLTDQGVLEHYHTSEPFGTPYYQIADHAQPDSDSDEF
nr:hypothetical protein GCM10020063_001810 [Dactylosporangium thailandense]